MSGGVVLVGGADVVTVVDNNEVGAVVSKLLDVVGELLRVLDDPERLVEGSTLVVGTRVSVEVTGAV
jgi:hypothetical protein